MSGSRKRRKANGKLRPAVRRYRRKKRKAWLDQFEPGVRAAFFGSVQREEALWIHELEKSLGREEAATRLDLVGTSGNWSKLRLRDGTVVGIAPPREGCEVVGFFEGGIRPPELGPPTPGDHDDAARLDAAYGETT